MKLQDSASKIVPEQVVEAACLEIGGLSEDQARLHMQRLSRRQPALLAFVTAFSEDLTKDGAELDSLSRDFKLELLMSRIDARVVAGTAALISKRWSRKLTLF